jgi:thiol:disulfide interchange protein DsbD
MAKRLYLLVMLVIAGFLTQAQAQLQDPVKWTYTARKKSAQVYEVVITATLPKPWHLYSQTTPKGGPIATKIKFTPNPLLTLEGTTKEVGKLLDEYDPNFKVNVKYFGEKVEFVQTVKLKVKSKTNIGGTITYMVCDDEKCLPPATKSFSVALQ